MSVLIGNKNYDIKNTKILELNNNKLSSLPTEIGNLVNLQELYLRGNQLSSMPAEIGNLVNLKELYLFNNQLSSIPEEILKIKTIVKIDETSYEVNDFNLDAKILLFSNFTIFLKNLPLNLKEIWLKKHIVEDEVKIPFNCKIIYY